MNRVLPPIYRDCRRLLVHTEEVVRRFSRYYKYTVRTDLRRQAMTLMPGVHLAVYDRAQQAAHVSALVWRVDEFKLTLQLAMEVGAFVHGKAGQQKPATPGFAAFEMAAQLAAGIGKQCGGWQKRQTVRLGLRKQVQSLPVTCTLNADPGAQAPVVARSMPAALPQAHPASLSARASPLAGATP